MADTTMTDTKTDDMTDGLQDALICLANYYRFQSGEKVQQQSVYSRMQLICHSGSGHVIINRQRYELHSGSLLICPWQRDTAYYADRSDPFILSGIHLIPHHPSHDVQWHQVAHSKSEHTNLFHHADREIIGFHDTVYTEISRSHRLWYLSKYILELFKGTHLQSQEMRALSQQLIHEWFALLEHRHEPSLPESLQRVCNYMRHNLSKQLNLQQYAQIARCSAATLHRLAHKHFSCTILHWQRRLQMQYASEQLRSSTTGIAVIAASCGFNDALYFSRVFK
ncbi:MAG: helix-turn-helix transcriptional regulator, partial [Planctomycetes bacterium]|nr:helix-turn-helix transcriptional regulator [Planctomycetota bacterium]